MALDEQATDAQVRAVARLCMAKGIREQPEDRRMTRREARDLMYDLRRRLNANSERR